jgi:DNA-binding transcriptional ArsR family regulator
MNEVDIFKALGDQTRLKILNCIRNGGKCICEITPATGKSQPNVSQHLKILEDAGLINKNKQGTNIFVKVTTQDVYQIINLVKTLGEKA